MHHSRFHKNGILALILLFSFFVSACCPKPHTLQYQQQYRHLKTHNSKNFSISHADFELFLLVNARHLDYSGGKELLKTLAKHPSDGSKNGDVGHAWILLRGILDGKNVVLEGGLSGELGNGQPRYFEGMMSRLECGDLNSAAYLWEAQKDGFFEKGSGGHTPTYAIKINLTEEQFVSILEYIDPKHYDYANYSLVSNQCSTFVANVAKIVGLEIDGEITVSIPQKLYFKRETLVLWQDPLYSHLSLSTPDILEKNMMHAVEQGFAEYALPSYLKIKKTHRCFRCRWNSFCEDLSNTPARYKRARFFHSLR